MQTAKQPQNRLLIMYLTRQLGMTSCMSFMSNRKLKRTEAIDEGRFLSSEDAKRRLLGNEVN